MTAMHIFTTDISLPLIVLSMFVDAPLERSQEHQIKVQ